MSSAEAHVSFWSSSFDFNSTHDSGFSKRRCAPRESAKQQNRNRARSYGKSRIEATWEARSCDIEANSKKCSRSDPIVTMRYHIASFQQRAYSSGGFNRETPALWKCPHVTASVFALVCRLFPPTHYNYAHTLHRNTTVIIYNFFLPTTEGLSVRGPHLRMTCFFLFHEDGFIERTKTPQITRLFFVPAGCQLSLSFLSFFFSQTQEVAH